MVYCLAPCLAIVKACLKNVSNDDCCRLDNLGKASGILFLQEDVHYLNDAVETILEGWKVVDRGKYWFPSSPKAASADFSGSLWNETVEEQSFLHRDGGHWCPCMDSCRWMKEEGRGQEGKCKAILEGEKTFSWYWLSQQLVQKALPWKGTRWHLVVPKHER